MKEQRSNNMDRIQEQYGERVMQFALLHIIDVGVRHLTKENVAQDKKVIAEKEKSPGQSFFSPELQFQILDCAEALAQLSHSEILTNCHNYLPTDR